MSTGSRLDSASVVQTYGVARSRSRTATNMAATSASDASARAQPAATGGPPPRDLDATFSNDEAPGVDWGWTGASDTSGTSRSCRRRYVETDTTYTTAIVTTYRLGSSESTRQRSTSWATPVTIATRRRRRRRDVSGNYDPRRAAAAVGTGVDTTTRHLERLHRGARDGQHDHRRLRLHDPGRRLRPQHQPDSRPTTRRAGGRCGRTVDLAPPARDGDAAPAWRARPARRRRGACRRGPAANMQTYVNALDPTGSTYHDIGMIWGARMISNGGIFADSPDTFNGMPVAAPHHLHDRRPDGHRPRHLRLPTASSRTTSASAACRARRRPSSTAATCSASG